MGAEAGGEMESVGIGVGVAVGSCPQATIARVRNTTHRIDRSATGDRLFKEPPPQQRCGYGASDKSPLSTYAPLGRKRGRAASTLHVHTLG